MEVVHYNAAWWDDETESSWDRVKDAFQRDWEQTKHDWGKKSADLDQQVSDTVKQAAGKEAIPPAGVPNYDDMEPAFRFGHGARRHYSAKHPTWNDELENSLRRDWSADHDDADWKRNRVPIRYAYEYNYGV